MLLGAAILGVVASGAAPDLRQAMSSMTRPGRILAPDREARAYHDAKYAVFKRMHADQRGYREIMGNAVAAPEGIAGTEPARG